MPSPMGVYTMGLVEAGSKNPAAAASPAKQTDPAEDKRIEALIDEVGQAMDSIRHGSSGRDVEQVVKALTLARDTLRQMGQAPGEAFSERPRTPRNSYVEVGRDGKARLKYRDR